jgi:hypothetical protein
MWNKSYFWSILMSDGSERRTEKRLQYNWPVIYSEDFTRRVDQGLMIDISSSGIAFDCDVEKYVPEPGQTLTVKFSLPRFDDKDPEAVVSIARTGCVCRADKVNSSVYRVAIQFDKPLTLKPYELANIELMRSQSHDS